MHRTHDPFRCNLQRSRGTRRLTLRTLGIVMAITVLQSFGMGLWSSRHLQAQQPPPATIIATTLFETKIDSPPGPTTISAATIALAPGQASLPLDGDGSLLILVQSGAVTLWIDHEIYGLPQVNDDENAGGPGIMYHLRTGQRVTIPTIGSIQFRNEGDEASSLLLLTLVPEGGSALPEASPAS